MRSSLSLRVRWAVQRAGIAAALVLAGCASTPRPAAPVASPGASGAVLAQDGRDGAEAQPPAGLEQVPDAVPRIEPIRAGGPNKPYEVFGVGYRPFTQDRPFLERGLASWYGRKFHGRRTASGERYDMYAMTAAHPTLPIPSYARVRNPANGREIVVRVNDRGPFHRGRIIDLSYTAALKLGVLRGVAPVEVERITAEDIRAGTWQRDMARPALTAAVSALPAALPAALPGSEADIAPTAPASVGPTAPAPAPVARATAGLVASPAPSSGVVLVAGSGSAERGVAGGAGAGSDGTAANAPDPGSASPSAAGLGLAQNGRATASPPGDGGASGATAASTRSGVPAGFWVQLGAFSQVDAASDFRRRIQGEVGWLGPLLAVFGERAPYRLQAGPYPTQDEARTAAQAIRAALHLVPLIVERR